MDTLVTSTVKAARGRVVHGRRRTAWGQETFCGIRDSRLRGGHFDLTPRAEDRVTCTPCLRVLDADKTTRRDEVPGTVIRVRWWNGKQWYVTHEARPA